MVYGPNLAPRRQGSTSIDDALHDAAKEGRRHGNKLR